MRNLPDDKIDALIAEKGARPRFIGGGWEDTRKLVPNGAHANDKNLAARLAPKNDE